MSMTSFSGGPAPRRVASIASAICALWATSASAATCFNTPSPVPGLPGDPEWPGGTAPTRSELNEPRWGAAPLTFFLGETEGGVPPPVLGYEGGYRVMVDPGYAQLSVSIQAFADPSTTAQDSVYFGVSTSATTARVVRLDLNPTGTDPVEVASGQEYTYDSTSPGPTPADKWMVSPSLPTWVEIPRAWSDAPVGASWGINFKVNLAAAGLASGTPFKIFIGQHQERGAVDLDLATPAFGAPQFPGELFPADPFADWFDADAINAGCPGGITINGNQIGTTNAQKNHINITNLATNTFFADVTSPVGLFPGQIQATFRLANWGSVADPAAGWELIQPNPGFTNPTPNGATATHLEFECLTNSGGQVCGLTPNLGADHQCMQVSLGPTPGNEAVFTKASAYTNMWFEALSEMSDTAEINVKGLAAKLGNKDPRDVYIVLVPRNLPPHGSEPIFLPVGKMVEARRKFDAPPPKPGIVDPKPPRRVDQRYLAKLQAQYREQQLRLAKESLQAQGDPAKAALALDYFQEMTAVWPTYDVHVYYDTKQPIRVRGEAPRNRLAPMTSFTYFFSHDEPLYGFTHAMEGVGFALEEIQPLVYKLTIPDEGTAQVRVRVSAEEKPVPDTKPPGECAECPPGQQPPPVDKSYHCHCEVMGARSGAANSLWLSLAALGVWFLRRRRARSS